MLKKELTWDALLTFNGQQPCFLLQKKENKRQQLLFLHAHAHLMQKEIILKGMQQCLPCLPGSFSNLALQLQYLSFLNQHNIDISDLARWKTMLEQWRNYKKSDLTQHSLIDLVTMSHSSIRLFSNQQSHIFFLHVVSEDLLQILFHQSTKLIEAQKDTFQIPYQINSTIEQLLQFLDYSIPKTLINFILKKQQLPLPLQKHKQLQCLYSNSQIQFVIRLSPNYSILIKVLLKTIIKRMNELSPNQEKQLIDVAFKYFYLHHFDKKYAAIEIFIQIFNHLSESVRYAMTEEFLLFLHLCRKIGKDKFVDVLLQKSKWMKEIQEKTSFKKLIGHKIESTVPSNRYGFGQEILIERGKSEIRYFQCIQDHSIIFLRVSIANFDINIVINLISDIVEGETTDFKRIQLDNLKGTTMRTILLPQRGIYSIEFDNSESWINSKLVNYQKQIYNPLSLHSINQYHFFDQYFLQKDMNLVSKHYLVQYATNQLDIVEIFKKDEMCSFILHTNKGQQRQIYHYETDHKVRFLQKILQLSKSQIQYQFYINNKAVSSIKDVQAFLNSHFPTNIQKSKGSIQKKKEQVLIEIPLKY